MSATEQGIAVKSPSPATSPAETIRLQVYVRPVKGEPFEASIVPLALDCSSESFYVWHSNSARRWLWKDIAEIIIKPMAA